MLGKYFISDEYYQMLKCIFYGSVICVLLFSALLILFRKKRNKYFIWGLVVSLAGYALGNFLCGCSVIASICTPFLKSVFVKSLFVNFMSIIKFFLMDGILIKLCRELLCWAEGRQSARKLVMYSLLPLFLLVICEYILVPIQMEIALEVPGTVLSRNTVGSYVKSSIYRPYTDWPSETIHLALIAAGVILSTSLQRWKPEIFKRDPVQKKKVHLDVWPLLCAGTILLGYSICVWFEKDVLIPICVLLTMSLILWIVLKENTFKGKNNSENRKNRAFSAQSLLIVISLALITCLLHYTFLFKEKKIVHDQYYGVRYTVENPQFTNLRINIDTISNEVITALSITHCGATSENKAAEELYEHFPIELRGITRGVSYQINKNEIPAHYLYQTQRNQGYFELIVLNFYRDDYSSFDMSAMYEYLGIESEMADGKITYLELKNCETFRFKWLFEKGEYENNISFFNEEKYTFREEK